MLLLFSIFAVGVLLFKMTFNDMLLNIIFYTYVLLHWYTNIIVIFSIVLNIYLIVKIIKKDILFKDVKGVLILSSILIITKIFFIILLNI